MNIENQLSPDGLRQPGPLGRLEGGHAMNRFKCPACGGEQYTACDTAEVLEKAEMLNSIIEWDEDGYPTEESLEQLEKVLNGDLKKAIKAFYAALKENYYGDSAVGLTKKEVRGEEREVWEYHTFGWSGNEAIISTLSQFPLWSVYLLERYDAGGHYYFKPWDEVKKMLESEGES